MPSPVEQFTGTPELVACLGRVVVNRKLLYDLCLTGKSFNASFTPFLYTEVWFRENNANFLVENLPTLLANRSLRHTKTLNIAIRRHSRKDTGQSEGALCELYNEGAQALLAKMPGLTHFSWEEVALYSTTISTLHRECANLQSLIIRHEEHIEERLGIIEDFDFHDGFHERRSLFATQDLSPFANLIELKVFEIHGDLNRARKDLVEVLLKSPNLKTLGMSISGDTVERLNSEGTWAKNKEYLMFLKTLCDEYVSGGGTPLQLQKLTLGLSLIVWHPGTYLNGLINLECLEDAYISNKGHDVAIYFEEEDNIAWSLFTPTHCPNLSKFGFDSFTKKVKEWAEKLDSGYIKQLRTEWINEDGFLDIASKLEGLPATSSSTMSFLSFSAELMDDFKPVQINCLQALAIGFRHRTPEQQSQFLSWISGLPGLEQLFLYDDMFSPVDSNINIPPAKDSFESKIVLQCKKLRYLRARQMAWRIWRIEKDGKEDVRFEILDRFESRFVEAFQSQSVFDTYY